MSFRTMVREVGWDSVASETKVCSLTAGCQLSIWKQMRRTFVTGHYLTVGSQCEDIKERQYLQKRTEVLRFVRNRIKNWCDTSRTVELPYTAKGSEPATDSKRMCFVGYSSMWPLTGNCNTRNYWERMEKVEQIQENCRNPWLHHILDSVCNS